MKGIRWTLIVSLSALLVCGLGGTALAFHGGGVADCSGCHTMHNSVAGQTVRTGVGTASYLLKAMTPSDTCLLCHAAYGQGAGGAGWGSGGDFSWITKTFSWDSHGITESKGDNHGHNIMSNTLNIAPDATLGTAPGGTYPSNQMGCNSCHDPHGQQHNALLLYGTGLTAANYTYNFNNAAPVLKSPGRTTNKTSSSTKSVSDTRHTAFGQGMSQWCANCHAGFRTGHVHPTDMAIGSTMAAAYGSYVSTGVATGSLATSYREKVPFEVGIDCTVSLSTSSTAGPVALQSKVMCLTCHRSHASANMFAGRWNFEAEDLSAAHPLAGDLGAPSADDLANKDYGEVFPAGQKSLCNKCHVKD